MSEPEIRSGYAVWSADDDGVRIRFVGRGPFRDRQRAFGAVAQQGCSLSWARQTHSRIVLEARPGECGSGDALVTRRLRRALCIATADCVPIVVAGRDRLAAVHAGWRGIAAGVVAAAVKRLGGEGLRAWIGPAIGACCYEVGPEVADAVVAASDPSAVRIADPRPYLDLRAAVGIQLAGLGVAEVRRLGPCTRCSPDTLHSYRREGAGAGRNYALAWLI